MIVETLDNVLKGSLSRDDKFVQSYALKAVAVVRLKPFPNKPWFLRICKSSLLKTLWEKRKLLVTSNFLFSHSMFYPFGEQV